MTVASNTIDIINKEDGRDSRLAILAPIGGSQLSVTLVLGTLPTSSGLHQHQTGIQAKPSIKR